MVIGAGAGADPLVLPADTSPKRQGVLPGILYAVPLFIVAFVVVGWVIVSIPPLPDTIPMLQKDGTTVNMTIRTPALPGC